MLDRLQYHLVEHQKIKLFVHICAYVHDEVSIQKEYTQNTDYPLIGWSGFLKWGAICLTIINITIKCNTEKTMHNKMYMLTELSAFKPDPSDLDDSPRYWPFLASPSASALDPERVVVADSMSDPEE